MFEPSSRGGVQDVKQGLLLFDDALREQGGLSHCVRVPVSLQVPKCP